MVITNGFPVQIQGKQHNAIIVTQTIPLARIVLSICEAYNIGINESASRVNASIGILLNMKSKIESINQSLTQAGSQTLSNSVRKPFQSISQSVGQSVSPSVTQSENQSIIQPVTHSLTQKFSPE